jgi:type II secretory pathway component GspD/PulD (secretin)
LDAIAQFDVPTAEVAVDVTIYEVDVANDNSLGLDFHAWKNGPGRNLFALGGFGEYEKIDKSGRSLINGVSQGLDAPYFDSGSNLAGIPATRMNNYGANAAFYYQVPSAYFDALNVKGKARIVNKTRVSILNGYTGEVASGDEFLYYDVQNGPAPIGGARNSWLDPLGQDATYPDNRTVVGKKATTGVALEVTPTIGTDMITLDVDYTVGTLTGFDGEGAPLVAEREQSSTVRVKDGEEVVLGGVVRDAKVQTTRKIPVLGSIPVLGYLFGGEISTAQKSMVVVILKPTVVQNFNNLTAEDQDLLAKVKGEVEAPLQPDQYGWDMYFMGR